MPRVSGGNPFMLRELLLSWRPSAARERGEAPHVRDVAPATIQRAVLVRLARLPDPASRLAQAVAVLGDDASSRKPPSLRTSIADAPPRRPMRSRPPA